MAVTTAPAYADANAVKNINSMYNASQAAQLAKLKSAYDQNVSNAQKAYNDINPAYQQKANDLGVQYERNRRNFNIQGRRQRSEHRRWFSGCACSELCLSAGLWQSEGCPAERS